MPNDQYNAVCSKKIVKGTFYTTCHPSHKVMNCRLFTAMWRGFFTLQTEFTLRPNIGQLNTVSAWSLLYAIFLFTYSLIKTSQVGKQNARHQRQIPNITRCNPSIP